MFDSQVDNPFLKDLTPRQHESLSGIFEPFAASAGTIIFREGDAATHLYLILRGRIAVQYKPYDGPKLTLADLRSGDIVGWSSVLGRASYTSDAVSTTRVEALRLRGDDLRSLCAREPALGKSILENLAKAVTPRWANARQQVQEVLSECVRSAP